MRHNIKQPKICIIGIPKEEEEEEKNISILFKNMENMGCLGGSVG